MLKYMKVYNTNGRSGYLKKFFVTAPPLFLEAPYKRYKLFMQKQLYTTYSTEMSVVDTYKVKGINPNKSLTNDQLIEKVMANPKEYYNYKKKKFVLEALQDSFKLSKDKAYNLIRLLNFKANNNSIPALS